MAELKEKKSNINIRNINSSYIIKNIFSFLNEKLKLDMIIYNKVLQKIVLVDIGDYKRVSGKYKICEKKGKGREYILNTKRLIYEGEYKNGKRNGKGKEYNDNGQLKFEGEYLDGKIWNGKGYNEDGNMDYEIKNGNGHIHEYYYNGNLKFEGDYLNGERNGKGKNYYYSPKTIFFF